MAAKRKQARTIAGDQFRTDLSGPTVAKPWRCWVGLLPECPANQADVMGINFVKHTENIVPDPSDPKSTARVPVIGTIAFLDPDRVDEFVDRMQRQVVRTISKRDDGSRVGKLIRIPSKAEVANGARPYRPKHDDEPLVRYAYLRVLDDQLEGQPGGKYPEPIEIAGITIPEDQEPGGLSSLAS